MFNSMVSESTETSEIDSKSDVEPSRVEVFIRVVEVAVLGGCREESWEIL